jgi:hypothetical protein
MSNPKVRIVLDVEIGSGTALSAQEHAHAIGRSVLGSISRGLLTKHEPEANIEDYSLRSAVLELGAFEMIEAGTQVQISAHTCRPGEGLSYPSKKAVLAEDCHPGGWDVVELQDGTSVYSFSVSHLDREVKRVRPDDVPSDATLREWARNPAPMAWGLDTLADYLLKLEKATRGIE